MNRPPSAGRLRRLNRQQRKKLPVGEFQDLVFEVRMTFRRPLDEPAHAVLVDALTDLIEAVFAVQRDPGLRIAIMAEAEARRGALRAEEPVVPRHEPCGSRPAAQASSAAIARDVIGQCRRRGAPDVATLADRW